MRKILLYFCRWTWQEYFDRNWSPGRKVRDEYSPFQIITLHNIRKQGTTLAYFVFLLTTSLLASVAGREVQGTQKHTYTHARTHTVCMRILNVHLRVRGWSRGAGDCYHRYPAGSPPLCSAATWTVTMETSTIVNVGGGKVWGNNLSRMRFFFSWP